MTKTEQVNKKLAEGRQKFFDVKRTIFKHYKGGVYKIHIDTIYLDAESGEAAVLYERIAGPDFDEYAEYGVKYGRIIDEFFDDVYVPIEGGVQRVARFTPVRRVEQVLYVPDQ